MKSIYIWGSSALLYPGAPGAVKTALTLSRCKSLSCSIHLQKEVVLPSWPARQITVRHSLDVDTKPPSLIALLKDCHPVHWL